MTPQVYAPSRADIRNNMTIAIDPTRVPVERKGRTVADRLSTVLHRRAGYILWRTLTLALIGMVGSWDVGGLLIGGDAAYTSASYDVLRLAPWGMRTYGAVLAVIVAWAVYGYGRHRSGHFMHIRLALVAFTAWYAFWLVAVAGTWVTYGEIVAWGAVGKLGFTAFAAFTLARATPHTVPDREGAASVGGPPRATGRHGRR